MGLVELFLIAVGLSMDAFAVAICKGLAMTRLNMRQAAIIALFFGGFQALMPLVGWALGYQFAQLVAPIDHWIAFLLLAFIGGKMIWDALHEEAEGESGDTTASATEAASDGKAVQSAANPALDMRELVMLAIATSIDALAVGVSFAFLQVDIVPAASFIGVVTFVLSFAGVAIGHQFGSRWEKPSAIVGGIVLILIGLKTLFEHLGVI